MFVNAPDGSSRSPEQPAAGSLRRMRWVFCALMLAPLQMHAAETQTPAQSRAATQQRLESAQKRLDEAAREVADLSMSLSEDVLGPNVMYSGSSRQRAVLGINIGSRRNQAGDDGVEILSVSPGGAAAAAGLQAGDVLTEVNGTVLRRAGDESPSSRLLEVMGDVEPGDKVAVRYRRAGKSLSASVAAGRQPTDRLVALPPGFAGGEPGRFAGLPHMALLRSDSAFGTAEMVALTPKLGQYFGTDKGLLLVRAPADARLKLEEGDVIIDIDGRVPESAVHASRILASYAGGEKLRLTILRMKKRMTLDVEMPADAGEKRFEQRLERSHFVVPEGGVPGPVAVPPPPGARIISLNGRGDIL